MTAIAIIPARGGSKGIPVKNIVQLHGHPLIAYSIEAALASCGVSRTIVSTDSEEIAEISKFYGAEVPFMRPAEFASDMSTDREFLIHALGWFAEHENFRPDYIVHLRPTTPLRDSEVIDDAIRIIKKTDAATSLRSAHLASKTPYKWFEMDDLGFFKGIRPYDLRPEYYNLPRQSFPNVYDPNGYVDLLRVSQLLSSPNVHGDAILGYVTPFCHELDSPEDLLLMNYLVERYDSSLLSALNKRLEIISC